jgi:hypothetical protein
MIQLRFTFRGATFRTKFWFKKTGSRDRISFKAIESKFESRSKVMKVKSKTNINIQGTWELV